MKAVPHYMEREDEKTKLIGHRNFSIQDENRLKEDWQSEINFKDDYSDRRKYLLYLMNELDLMWDGRIRTVWKVKNRIKTDPEDTGLIRSAPYLGGTESRELDKE